MDVSYYVFFFHVFSETERTKDWEQQISQMKQAFEKQLQSERTLKTQVEKATSLSLNSPDLCGFFRRKRSSAVNFTVVTALVFVYRPSISWRRS